MKILALMPAQKVLMVEAVQSLVAFQADIYNRGDNVNICFTNGHNPVNARTSLANYVSKANEGDYVLWIDSDHIYAPKKFYTLVEKLEKNNLEMLSAAYLVRSKGRTTAHGSFLEDGSFKQHQIEEQSGITDCDVLGFGFLVMKYSFLKRMVEKYPNDLFHMDCSNNSTEDVYFCRQVKKEGVRICYDADTIIGHLTVVVNK